MRLSAQLLLPVVGLAATAQVSQIYLSLTGLDSEMMVSFSTNGSAPFPSTVRYGARLAASCDANSLVQTATGQSFIFDYNMTSPLRLHNVLLTGLKSNTSYCYSFDATAAPNDPIYSFVAAPIRPDRSKIYAVLGDLGLENAISLPELIAEGAEEGEFDAIINAGDYAYDLHDDGGAVGNAYMESIQPLTSAMPMNGCPGNHERMDDNSFAHFINRFSGFGAGAGANSASNTPLYFSFNDHLVHWISVDTEMWPYGWPESEINRMLAWMDFDLASVNRTQTPWVFIIGHRQQWMDVDQGTNFTAIDALMKKYHVEMGFFGHQHEYQRLLPMNDGSVHPGCTSDDHSVYLNCNHTANIVVGSPGCSHGIGSHTAPDNYLAVTVFDYGYGMLTVYNASHAQWQWYKTAAPYDGRPTGANSTGLGRTGRLHSRFGEPELADDFWVVDYYHGGFYTVPTGN